MAYAQCLWTDTPAPNMTTSISLIELVDVSGSSYVGNFPLEIENLLKIDEPFPP